MKFKLQLCQLTLYVFSLALRTAMVDAVVVAAVVAEAGVVEVS